MVSRGKCASARIATSSGRSERRKGSPPLRLTIIAPWLGELAAMTRQASSSGCGTPASAPVIAESASRFAARRDLPRAPDGTPLEVGGHESCLLAQGRARPRGGGPPPAPRPSTSAPHRDGHPETPRHLGHAFEMAGDLHGADLAPAARPRPGGSRAGRRGVRRPHPARPRGSASSRRAARSPRISGLIPRCPRKPKAARPVSKIASRNRNDPGDSA